MNTNCNNLLRLKQLIEQNKESLKKKGLQTSFAFLFLSIVGSSNINPFSLQTYASENGVVDETVVSFPENNLEIELNYYPPSQVGPGVVNTSSSSIDSISIEEKTIFVLQHYQMNEVDFQTFVNAIIIESSLCGSSIDQNQIVSILYDLAMIPNEVKINHILITRGITLEQFAKTSQVVLAESAHDGTNYLDAFGVTSILINRIVSPIWAGYGQNVFEQAYARGQFSVVKNGRIASFVNRSDLIGYQAFIDCLYLGGSLPMHGYTSFKAWSKSPVGKIAFVHGGNRFEFEGELTVEARAMRYTLNDPMHLQYFSSIQEQEPELVPVLMVQNN